jgi:GNAT superfamily N-acetyltransferase
MAHLRPALPTDAGATGEILYRFQQNSDWMPKLYSEVETIAFCGTMIDRGWVTVAEADGRIVGFMARDGEEICALYLVREVSGQGIGTELLNHAKSLSPRLTLRAVQGNSSAVRFYRREGFVETSRGDGTDNDENLPDIAFLWTAKAQAKAPADTHDIHGIAKPARESKL